MKRLPTSSVASAWNWSRRPFARFNTPRETKQRHPHWSVVPEQYHDRVVERLNERVGPGLRRVFNMTGTIIHTNLGRAQISRAMAQAGVDAAINPVTLEYDLDESRRGDRDAVIEPMLCALTGAEAATVVNNNAAALLLVLNSLGLGRSVPVSRGELIEIGGSFRLPDIIERSGCRIREVGTTNRTHPDDFAQAIDESTALLLKVHPSNYRIEGFTRSVDDAGARRHRARTRTCRSLSISAAARWSTSLALACRTNPPSPKR